MAHAHNQAFRQDIERSRLFAEQGLTSRQIAWPEHQGGTNAPAAPSGVFLPVPAPPATGTAFS